MKLDEKRDLTKMSILKALFFLALPIIWVNILQIWYQLIDNFWVWRFSKEWLAVMTLWGNVVFLTFSLWSWFAIAWSILVAQFFGAKNHKMVNHIAAQSIIAVFLVWIILSIIWLFSAPTIIRFMWVEENLFNGALLFVRILFIWLVFNYLFFMFQSIIRWVWEVKIPIYIAILGLILNFILDPIFVAWYWPFPAWWAVWAGVVSIILQIISCFIGLFILFSWKLGIKIKLEDLRPDWKVIKDNFKLWLPSSIEMMSRSLSFTIITWIIASVWAQRAMQTELLDAYGIGWMILQITIFISIWFSMATTVLVGQHAGAGHYHKAKSTAYISAILSFVMMTILGIVIFIFSPQIIEVFVPNSPKINELWTEMVRTSALFLWLIWIQMTLMWAMRAIWKTWIPMFITIFWIWFVIPIIYYFANYEVFGLNLWEKAIWWGNVLQMFIIVILVILVMLKINWYKINITKHEEYIN